MDEAGNIWWKSFCGNQTVYNAFWSYQLSVNTSDPDVTLCFQRTVLTWIPCALLWIWTPIYIGILSHRPTISTYSQLSTFNIFKTIVGICLCLTALVNLVWICTEDLYPAATSSDYVAFVIILCTMMLVTWLTSWEFCKGQHSSGMMFMFWLTMVMCEIPQVRSLVMRVNSRNFMEGDRFVITQNLFFVLVILQFGMTFVPDQSALVSKEVPDEELKSLLSVSTSTEAEEEEDMCKDKKQVLMPCPELRMPFWSRLTFWWITMDIIKGYWNPPTFDQLPCLKEEDSTSVLVPRFKRLFYDQRKPTNGDRAKVTAGTCRSHRSFVWTLFRCVGYHLIVGTVLRLCALILTLINPLLLRYLIAWVSSDDPYEWKGLFLAGLMFFLICVTSVILHHFLHSTYMAGLQARSIANAAVYQKSLKLSSSARRHTTVGQIVNLMSVDAQKIQEAATYLTLVWSVPLLVILSVYFLWVTVGRASMAGMWVLLFLIPLNSVYLANLTRKLQIKQMGAKDQRVRLTTEVLSGMKVLKMYAWEPSFQDKLLDCRQRELNDIKTINYINAFGAMCWLLSPYLVSLAIFASFVMSSADNVMTAETAFVTLALINLLNFPLSLLPVGVSITIQAYVSVKRISKFLQLDEVDEDAVEKGRLFDDNVIKIEDGTFSWAEGDKPVLRNIQLEVARGSLVAIVGQVGCGKSSLISTLLGELHKEQGRVRINGSLAYVPQQAWIQLATLRDNILFGKPMVDDVYENIISACALNPDLEILPGGDLTEIGEKGINLSGGQKQRVSIARSVYQDMEIYLLDDPLSAVDAHVGKHIFEKVIGPKGLLRNKTRLFVTHGVSYLPYVDAIVVLEDGRISEVGQFEELLAKNGAFAEVLRTFFAENTDTESDGECDQLRERLGVLDSPTDADTSNIPRRRKSSCRHKSGRSSRSSEGSPPKVMIGLEKLVTEETTQVGVIKFGILTSYIKAGGYWMFGLTIFCHLFLMAFQIYTNIWLSEWSIDYTVSNVTVGDPWTQTKRRLAVYGGFGVAQVIFALGEAFTVAYGCYCASRVFLERLLDRIMHAPMTFFDTTPLGRIMNRFSKDVDSLDTSMPMFIRQWLFAVVPVLSTVFLIAYTTPIFLAAAVPITIIYCLAQRFYISTVRQLKRIDNVRRSPLYTHFDESIEGATSIRAYGKETEFIAKCNKLIDESQRPWFLICVAYRWCGVTMEFLGGLIVFLACMFAVQQRSSLSAGLVGLSVSYALQITSYLNPVVRSASDLETYVVSAERIEEYCHIDIEAPWRVPESKPPSDWPHSGQVEFSNYATRYRPGLALVLRHITCSIKPGQKIGIVGRTGAGKSSLALALFRILEAAKGSISIDHLNIGTLGLHDLRSKLTIIPQDPVVFSGSLRNNLDPFQQYSDYDLWTALGRAHLDTFVSSLSTGLDYECGDGGQSLSVGQRQLLCLARALLRDSKILLLDEATAAVDLATDALIQTTIRTQFSQCTVLTVAHRLHTIMDYERIMVLDNGRLMEFDTPAKLMEDKFSIFYGMAKDASLTR